MRGPLLACLCTLHVMCRRYVASDPPCLMALLWNEGYDGKSQSHFCYPLFYWNREVLLWKRPVITIRELPVCKMRGSMQVKGLLSCCRKFSISCCRFPSSVIFWSILCSMEMKLISKTLIIHMAAMLDLCPSMQFWLSSKKLVRFNNWIDLCCLTSRVLTVGQGSRFWGIAHHQRLYSFPLFFEGRVQW